MLKDLPVFKLEDYLAQYEFSVPYLLCSSDPESWSLKDVIAMANPEERKLWENIHLSYTEVQGLPLLRDAIARGFYPGLGMENILCFAGAQEGILGTLSMLCDREDHVIIVKPYYQSLYEVPKAQGCSMSVLQLREENNWALDLDELEKLIRPNTKWFITNYPNNPTGQLLEEKELKALIQILDKHSIYLFCDEVYRLSGPEPIQWTSPVATLYPKGISLSVMSKAFGMPGLRVGWIACQDVNLIEKVKKIKYYTSICNSGLSEVVSIITIRNKDKILSYNNELIGKNFRLLQEFFKRHAEIFSWAPPKGGCIGFVRYKKEEPIEKFCDRLVKKAGVLLIPGSVFDLESNHFRIGFGRKNMPEALRLLEKFIV